MQMHWCPPITEKQLKDADVDWQECSNAYGIDLHKGPTRRPDQGGEDEAPGRDRLAEQESVVDATRDEEGFLEASRIGA